MAYSVTKGLYTDKLNSPVVSMVFDAVESYLDYLGCVKVHDKDHMVHQVYDPHTFVNHEFTFTCQVLDKDYKYFRDLPHAYVKRQDSYPKLNYDNIRSNVDLNDFSAVEYETVITFEFRVVASTPDDINTIIKSLKTYTKDLLYKKFSDEVDEQIIDEIGE